MGHGALSLSLSLSLSTTGGILRLVQVFRVICEFSVGEWGGNWDSFFFLPFWDEGAGRFCFLGPMCMVWGMDEWFCRLGGLCVCIAHDSTHLESE